MSDNEPSLWHISTVLFVALIAALIAVGVMAVVSLVVADGKPVY